MPDGRFPSQTDAPKNKGEAVAHEAPRSVEAMFRHVFQLAFDIPDTAFEIVDTQMKFLQTTTMIRCTISSVPQNYKMVHEVF